ncbi:hypothetical protein [Yersinia massiliensis]|uniref:hypothetical protein n=1 Tax=Yersinia massiliensis TaxID=419257 RepID=UPI0028D096F5|nr:hypothetical protein [Yersinia massiliensis]
MSQIILVKMARPSADEVESLYKLFHASEAAEDRWNRESSEQFLERLDDQDISNEERVFIAVAWDSLVQGHGGFGRFIGAYDTLIYNFQDPDADHVAIHPKFNALFAGSELLPVVLEGYADARNTIAELENERNAALNTCSLIAKALGIKGAVAGDTIARVQQLVAEGAVMLKLLTDISENHSEFVDEAEDCMCASIPLDYVSEINAYVSRDVNAENPFIATDASINEIKALGVDAFADDLGETIKGLSTTSTQYKAVKSIVFRAVKFAASLRGGE